MPLTAQARVKGNRSPGDSKEALLQAAQAAMEDSRRKRGERPAHRRRASRATMLVAAGTLFALSVYLLAARPVWFFTPPPPPEPPEIQEASMRLTLVREAARIRQYRLANGQLPGSLEETGSPMQGLTYAPSGDGAFTLSGRARGQMLTLRSTDAVDAFLGNSFQIIQGRVGK